LGYFIDEGLGLLKGRLIYSSSLLKKRMSGFASSANCIFIPYSIRACCWWRKRCWSSC